MPCYHPLRRFSIGINPDTGKSIGKVVPYDVQYLELGTDGRWYYHYDMNFLRQERPYAAKIFTESQEIPCGKCIGCRLSNAQQWATRLMCEVPEHLESWFLTLTYNDDELPSHWAYDPEGNLCNFHSLVKSDIQLFMKRFRKCFPARSVSFFCCGEYGSLTNRPHYHLILFLDVSLLSSSVNTLHKYVDGHAYYTNDLIDRLWYRPGREGVSAGFHYITDVTFDTCSYVSRYVTKKVNGDDLEILKSVGMQPVFSLQSRRPAIGRRFFDDPDNARRCYEDYFMLVPGTSKRVRPPRYFDNLFDIENHSELCDYKAVHQKAASDRIISILAQTDKDYLTYLFDEELAFKARASAYMKNKNANKV